MPPGTARSIEGDFVLREGGFAVDLDGDGNWRLNLRDERASVKSAGGKIPFED